MQLWPASGRPRPPARTGGVTLAEPGYAWATLASRTLLEHPRLTVMEDDVRLPGGETISYLRYVGRPDGVCVICRRDGLVLLQREYVYPSNRMVWQFPGGGLEPGEDPVAAARRELLEEAGLRLDRLRPIGHYLVHPRRNTACMHVFVADAGAEVPPAPEREERIEPVWLSETEVDELLCHGQLDTGHTLAAWALYRARGQG